MKYLVAFLLFLVVGLTGAAGWVATKYKLQATVVGDDYMVMTEKQASECADPQSGGCAIFSEREFNRVLMMLLQQYGGRRNNSL